MDKCINCGCKDKDDLYKLDNKLLCIDCIIDILRGRKVLSIQETITYWTNGECFEEGEESEMFDFLGIESYSN